MKKIFTGGIILTALFLGLTGCEKQEMPIKNNDNALDVQESILKQKTANWKHYINPIIHYEYFHPDYWEVEEKNGLDSDVCLTDGDEEVMRFKVYPNLEKEKTLPEFFAEDFSIDLLTSQYLMEEAEIDGQKAYWFTGVEGRVKDKPAEKTEVVALDLGTRFLVIDIFKDWPTAKLLLNKINFYPAKSK